MRRDRKKIPIEVPTAMKKALEDKAEELGLTTSALIRLRLKEYLNENPPQEASQR